MTSPDQALLLDTGLAADTDLNAACVDAFLRASLPPDEERLVSLNHLEKSLPFLSAEDIMLALTQLQRVGRLQMQPGGAGKVPLRLLPAEVPAAAAPPASARQPMTLDWVPGEDAVQLLTDQGIPESFWRAELNGFRLYWKERGGSGHWEYRFLRWIQRGWVQQEPPASDQACPDWRPDRQCLDGLKARGLNAEALARLVEEFCADASQLIGDPARIRQRFESWALYQRDLIRHGEGEPEPARGLADSSDLVRGAEPEAPAG